MKTEEKIPVICLLVLSDDEDTTNGRFASAGFWHQKLIKAVGPICLHSFSLPLNGNGEYLEKMVGKSNFFVLYQENRKKIIEAEKINRLIGNILKKNDLRVFASPGLEKYLPSIKNRSVIMETLADLPKKINGNFIEPAPTKVLFWQNDYPFTDTANPYFRNRSLIHKNLENISGRTLDWSFFGGFIDEKCDDFWKIAKKTNIMFTQPVNMNYTDIKMSREQAEEKMLGVIKKIKAENPGIKIFFFGKRTKTFVQEGEYILDFARDKTVVRYFRTL